MDKLTFKIGVVIFFTCLSNGLDAAIDASTNNHDGKSFGAQSSPFSPLTDRHIQNGPKLSSDLVKRPANGTPVDIFPPRRFPVAPTVPRFEVSSSEENNIAWPGDYRSMWALSLFRLDRNESEFLLMNVNTNLEVKLLMDGSTLSLGRLSAIDEAIMK